MKECTWRSRQKNMSSSSSGSHLGEATTPQYRQATKLFQNKKGRGCGLRSLVKRRDILSKIRPYYRPMLRIIVWKWVIQQLHIQKVHRRRESALFAAKDYPRYKYKLLPFQFSSYKASPRLCIVLLKKTQIEVKYCCDFIV